MMSSAADSVFNTGELLEGILVHVDIRTLLLSATRVCRSWNAVIDASLPLQQALFFHPIEVRVEVEEGSHHVEPKEQNPFLKGLFPAWFENTNTFHPGVQSVTHSSFGYSPTVMGGYKRFQETKLYKDSLGSGDNPFLYPSASWRRMLTSQPACRKVIASCGRVPAIALGKTVQHSLVSDKQDGLRMGDLYDITLKHSTQHEATGFMVVWPEGDEEGYVHLVRHLRRAAGLLSVKFESAVRIMWERRPDLVLQLIWSHNPSNPGITDVASNELDKFWSRCGYQMPPAGQPAKDCLFDFPTKFDFQPICLYTADE